MIRFSAILSSVLLVMASSAFAAIRDSDSIRQLEARAIERGSVRVIVELRADHRGEGELSLSQVGRQRQQIAGTQERVAQSLGEHGVLATTRFATIPYMALVVDAEALERLRELPEVVAITEERAFPPSLDKSIPKIGADVALDQGFTGAGQAVAILDTGVDTSHSFFAGRIVSEACFSTTDAGAGATTNCPNGQDSQIGAGSGVECSSSGLACDHGTHVAGIAAGSGASLRGVAPDAKIVAMQVFSVVDSSDLCGETVPCLLAFENDIIQGLERVQSLAASLSIAAANLSLGGDEYTSPCNGDVTRPIIDSLYSRGVATVVASGNDGFTNAVGSPACVPKAITVGATNDFDRVTDFSNSSPMVDMLAPGQRIESSVPNGGFENKNGTSMATPHVAGAWAVLKQKVPSASVAQVEAALESTGIAITDEKNGLTKPRIQLDAALAVLSASLNPPTQLTATLEGLIVELSWRDNSNNEEGFRIYRSVDGEEAEVLVELEANTTSYSDETIEAGHSYAYQATSFTSLQESRVSNTATVESSCTPPAAPTDLFAVPTSAFAMRATWADRSQDESGFQVEISPGGSGDWTVAAITAADTTTADLTSLVPDTEYAVRVAAMGEESCLSSYDETRTWTPVDDSTPPAAPDQLLSILDDGFVTLTWRDNSDNELEFSVERRTADPEGDFEVVATLPIDNSTVTPITDVDGHAAGMDYDYRVRARGVGGYSAYSLPASIEFPAAGDSCTPSTSRACVDSQRFRVDVAWRALSRSEEQGVTGAPIAVKDLGELSTSFAFFDPDKTELILKVLNGSGLNDRYWVFYGALSDVEYWISVTDTETGAVVSYYNEQGNICGLADTDALPGDAASTSEASMLEARTFPAAAPGETGSCVQDPSTLCLQDDRFEVRVDWSNPLGESGIGTAVPDNDTTGFFWFKNSNNIELAVKIADGTSINGRFWVFYGALTNVAYEITVTDTVEDVTKVYVNPQGDVCGLADTDAF